MGTGPTKDTAADTAAKGERKPKALHMHLAFV